MPALTAMRALAGLAACLVLGGLISVDCKQDGSWDMMNYHLYNAWALLEGRFGRDLWVAGVQTTFNPLLDVPYYLVCRWLPDHPRCVAFLAGLPFGALLAVVPLVNAALWRGERAWVWVAVASAIGMTGTTVRSVIGSTSGDLPTAVLILTGLLAVLLAAENAARWPRACALAGAAVGLAAGLKLTNIVYGPALGLAVLACAPAGRRWTGAGAFIAGWCAGFLPPVVWWGARLWHAFGNPLFPLFNDIFRSPWAGAVQARDTRFLPKTFLQAIFYPFFWLTGRSFVVTESALREPRYALAYAGIVLLLARYGLERKRVPAAVGCLLIFTVAAFAAWEALFSILRYAVVLELLTGSWIVLALAAWLPEARLRAGVSAVVLAAIFATETTHDGGRLKRYGPHVFDIGLPAVPDGTTVALTGRPFGFLLPFFPEQGLSFVNTSDLRRGSGLERAVLARLTRQPFALVNRTPGNGLAELRRAGWEIDRCAPVQTRFQSGVSLCTTRAAAGAPLQTR